MEQLSNQVVLAAVVSFAIQALKKSQRFPWFSQYTARANRLAAIIGSGLAALGIHIVCSKVNHSCVVTWIDGFTIVSGLWHWFAQFCFTHGWYKAVNQEVPLNSISQK